MNKKRIRKYLILLLVVIECISLTLTFKAYSNKEVINIKEEHKVDRKKFAMFVKQDGSYVEYTGGDVFPNGYKLNLDKSSCVDTTGKVIEDVISYNNGMTTITSNKTAYCYLYFDIPLTADTMPTEITELWNSPLEGDGYRYVGEDPNNYVCFGTTNQERCIEESDKFMYRIIGIFEDSSGEQHIKLIKKDALENTEWWHADFATDTDWDESDLFTNLHEIVLNDIYGYGFDYMQDLNWYNKISTWDYTATNTKTYESSGPDYSIIPTSDIYLHEMNRDSKTNSVGEWKTVRAKLGLMYVSDFALSLGSEALNYINNSNSTNYSSSWLKPDNYSDNYYGEWTITRSGWDGVNNCAWDIDWWEDETATLQSTYDVSVTRSIRPVFYLNNEVELVNGSGSSESPYMIE